jgi:hypothetical protein
LAKKKKTIAMEFWEKTKNKKSTFWELWELWKTPIIRRPWL